MKQNKQPVQLTVGMTTRFVNDTNLLKEVFLHSFPGREVTILSISPEEGYVYQFEVRDILTGNVWNCARRHLQPVNGSIKKFGQSTIEELRRVGGNAQIQSELQGRINSSVQILQQSTENSNKDFVKKLREVEALIREAKMLHKALKPAPKQ